MQSPTMQFPTIPHMMALPRGVTQLTPTTLRRDPSESGRYDGSVLLTENLTGARVISRESQSAGRGDGDGQRRWVMRGYVAGDG